MNSHNSVLLLGANAVLRYLNESGFQGVVCGGFARDVQYSQNAKDIDIAVGIEGYSVADLIALTDKLEEHYAIRMYWSGQDHPKATSDNDRLDDPRCADQAPSEPTEQDHCVRLVVQVPVLKLDIVFYDVEADAATLVAQHDCNLNQFVMAGTLPVFLGSFHPDKHGLRIVKDGLHPGRVAYMEEKWDAINPQPHATQEDFPFP
ncbi:putative nucleotidyltransferase [Pseudomonas phage Njord]|uniref:Putative nucleotidyltransferase n=1 Tax=Pseudomonas phage Njord TaxID=2163985 RepID=A0A2S1GMK0_9CAUD|nr:nucleotidyltransferase [Pseudomonas phage Njord]AWD90599.1 putative nucleotidyltransferase [Pseudomonas phage Njord]